MALTPDGSLGGLAVVAESTYGTTPAVPTWAWMNHVNSTVGPRRSIIQPQWATFKPSTNRAYDVPWCDGEIKVALTQERDIIGPLLACGANLSGNDYTFGSGDEPDSNSFSLLQNFGGGHATTAANYYEWIIAGCKPTAYRFEIPLDSNPTLTVPIIGQNATQTGAGSAETPSYPDESYIMMPSDFGTITWGGSSTAFTAQGASIEVSLPKSGQERRGLGASSFREPVSNGQPEINFNITVDLDASTGNITTAFLALLIGGTELGTINIGPFELTECMLEGDTPSLQAGLMQFPLRGRASSLVFTSTDTIT